MIAPPCLVETPGATGRSTAVLWGDSHALQLASAFRDAVRGDGVNGRIMTKAGCEPVPGYDFYPVDPMRQDCRRFNDAVVARIIGDPDVDTVIVAGRWDGFFSGAQRVADRRSAPATDTAENLRRSFATLSRQIRASGRRVVFVGPAPIAGGYPLDCAERALFNRRDPAVCATRLYADAALLDRWFLGLLPGGASVIDLVAIGCLDRRCPHPDAAHPVLRDNSHFSESGAAFAEPALERAIRKPGG